jgi:hypothetical protein
MNEQEVRALVREAVERHLRPSKREPEKRDRESSSTIGPEKDSRSLFSEPDFGRAGRVAHASHIILQVAPGSEIDDGMCVIEPAVRCNHCGFCQSYGH